MRHRASSLLLVVLTLFAARTGAVLSATLAVPPKTTTQPTVNAPTGAQPSPKVTAPLPTVPTVGNAPPSPNYVGPTENLTKVANAISLRSLSLTTQLTFFSGRALTKPVCITVLYSSYSGGTYSTALLQTYDATSGNRFLFNDKEGLGTPRQATLRIQLFEPASGGCGGRVLGTGFDLPDLRVNLDPLYDATMGAIQFVRLTNCSLWMNQDIRARWFSPDNQAHEVSFRLGSETTHSIVESEWVAPAVSASANYHTPSIGFYGFIPGEPSGPSNINLIPAPLSAGTPIQTQVISSSVSDPSHQCGAVARYVIIRQLKQYPNL